MDLNTNNNYHSQRKKISQREYSLENTKLIPKTEQEQGKYVKAKLDLFQDFYAKLEDEYMADRRDLEEQLAQRSLELASATKELDNKQQELAMYKKDLERANNELIDINDALSVLARHVDRKRDDFEKKIARTICSRILPLIEELQQDKIPKRSLIKLDVLTTYLQSMTPRISKSREIIVALSPMELRVATMVRKGFSSEEIARMLHLSTHTIKTHRRSIRRKLNIRNLQINLTTYLKFKLGGLDSLD